jgi:methionine sulfoxide reductase heme-binding subunit
VVIWALNPVETVLQRTGRTAVILLLLSLTCTPIHNLFKLPSIKHLRKPLGIYAALYAALHFAAFAIWDYGLNLRLIWMEIREKPFILLGLVALIILLILAATSLRTFQRKLGKAWVWLHRLVYLAAALTILHYLLAVKGDLFSLQGEYTLPLLAAGVLILLFLLRLPAIYQPIRRLLGRD